MKEKPLSQAPPKTIGYIRVSDEDQVKSGLGLESQEAMLREFARQGKCPPIEEPIEHDKGFSGKKKAKLSQRPGLRSAVSRVGPGDILLVTKTDRFARNTMEALLIEEILKKNGARLVSTAGEGTDGDDDDPSTFLIRGLFRLLNEWESLNIGKRISAVFGLKRSMGEFCGGQVPFGYDAIENGQVRRGRDGRVTKIRILTPNKGEQETVTWIRASSASGMSERAIANALNLRGIQTKGGGKWHKTTVRRILASKDTAVPAKPHPTDG